MRGSGLKLIVEVIQEKPLLVKVKETDGLIPWSNLSVPFFQILSLESKVWQVSDHGGSEWLAMEMLRTAKMKGEPFYTGLASLGVTDDAIREFCAPLK